MTYIVFMLYIRVTNRERKNKMNLLNEYIIDEFPSPEYDRNFINDLVDNYSGDINPNGDLLDNMGLFNYIWESLVAIEHPSTEPVDVVNDLDDLISDEKESGKYKVVLAPSFPEEYRTVFEEILKDWEKEDENN